MEVEELSHRKTKILIDFLHVSARPRRGKNRVQPPTVINSPESDLAHPGLTTLSPGVDELMQSMEVVATRIRALSARRENRAARARRCSHG
jgi:hypothetical protein